MRGLFFKIFIIFWIAQSLIFVISTAWFLRHRFLPTPDTVRDSLFASLRIEAAETTAALESGGCASVLAGAIAHGRAIVLEDHAQHVLCASPNDAAISTPQAGSNEIGGAQAGERYVWNVPVISTSGKKYFFQVGVMHRPQEHTWYQDLLHFGFPQIPISLGVGGATTFLLVLIFTRPVIRLRQAARELAHGNLGARVKESRAPSPIFRGDEFQALVHDFNHMAERLESLVDAQKLLLRDVSHELRSPLARLSVALELAREDADSTMTTHLDRIQRETERLNQLIGQLLTLSSMEAVEGAERFEPVSLKSLLEEMLPDAEYEARQRDASVELEANCDCVIDGRRELIYRAIENVVRNAVRYTEPGTEVEIRL